MYRVLIKSIWCRDSVQQREAGGGETGRLDIQLGLPDRAGNLADRNAEHNRCKNRRKTQDSKLRFRAASCRNFDLLICGFAADMQVMFPSNRDAAT